MCVMGYEDKKEDRNLLSILNKKFGEGLLA